MSHRRLRLTLSLVGLFFLISACAHDQRTSVEVGGHIVVGGEAVPIGIPVKSYQDGSGFNAELERCHFRPERVLPTNPAAGCDVPKRYGERHVKGLHAETALSVESEGWSRTALRERISQFIVHYDVCTTSHRCFEVLHDIRGLSVHFLLDIDGTLYQTLDLSRRARHAGRANDRSLGIEIAHIGAYRPGDDSWKAYYSEADEDGFRRLTIPEKLLPPEGEFLTARPGLFEGTINGSKLVQPDFTEAQYRTLEKLFDWLASEFPKLKKATPRDAAGNLAYDVMDPEELESFEGFLGHHHVTKVKTDPGPAFDWERLLATRADP